MPAKTSSLSRTSSCPCFASPRPQARHMPVAPLGDHILARGCREIRSIIIKQTPLLLSCMSGKTSRLGLYDQLVPCPHKLAHGHTPWNTLIFAYCFRAPTFAKVFASVNTALWGMVARQNRTPTTTFLEYSRFSISRNQVTQPNLIHAQTLLQAPAVARDCKTG